MYSVSTQAEEGWVILGYSHITLVCAHANYAFRRRMQAEAATFAVMVIKESAVIVKCMILGGGGGGWVDLPFSWIATYSIIQMPHSCLHNEALSYKTLGTLQ